MCILKITSETFSFKNLANRTSLPIYSLYDKGEKICENVEQKIPYYALSINVSEAEWDELDKQIADCITFLNKNQNEIEQILSSNSDIKGYLDFPIWSRISEDVVNQNDQFPPELISLAGKLNLGLELGIYHKSAFD